MPEELTFAEKIKSIQTNGGRSRPIRRETRDDNGHIRREVSRPTDAGSDVTVTNRTDKRGGEHQDVHVEAGVIRHKAGDR